MQLKIVSLNLAGYKDWESREQKIADFIAGENPDIVFFQEVKFDADRSVYGQSAALNRLLKDPFPFTQTAISKFYQSSSGNIHREGLAILSRLPIVNSEALVLNKHADDMHPRIVQNADLEMDGRQILVSNVHFSNNRYSVEQLAECIRILQSRNEKRIIVGDFNIFELQNNSSLYEDSYRASVAVKSYISFPSEGRTLDYALIPKDMTFGSFEVYAGLSDHNALKFTVDL